MAPSTKVKKPQVHLWLRNMIDLHICPGVVWENKSKAIFKVPWSNQKTAEWREEDARIFLEYAKHTGRYRADGKKNFPKFKQNFKSALYKNRFLKRLTNHKSKAYRRYMFLEKPRSLSSGEQENEEIVAGPSAMEETHSLMMKDANAAPEISFLDEVNSLPASNRTFPDGLSSIDFLHGEVATLLDTEMPSGNNHLSLLENKSTNDLRGALATDSSFEECDVNQIFKKLNLSATQQHVDHSQIPSFLQNTTVDSTTDTVEGNCTNPGGVTDQCQDLSSLLVQDHALTVTKESEGATVEPPNTNIHIMETSINGNTGIHYTQAFQKVSNSVTVQESQLQSSSVTCTQGQSSQVSLCSMDTSNGQSSLARQESSQSNSLISSSISESHVRVSGDTQASDLGLMQIQVIYGTPLRVVKTEIIRSNKCRIFFGKVDHKKIQQVIDNKDKDAVQIELPSVEDLDFSIESKNKIRKVLQKMELGIVITYRDDDIYVVRRCQPRIFLSDGVSKSESLPRSKITEEDIEVKAFDYNGSFLNSIRSHKERGTAVDRRYFLLTFGYTIVANDPSPFKFLPVFVQVDHLLATCKRKEELGPLAVESDPACSLSNSFDNMMHLSQVPTLE